MCLGIPGQLTEIFEEQSLRMGKVRFSGVQRAVCLELVPDAVCGGSRKRSDSQRIGTFNHPIV